MINVSSDIFNTVSTNVASVIQQLWVVLAIFIALNITFYIIRKIIFLFTISKR
jgi:hypothetical protein